MKNQKLKRKIRSLSIFLGILIGSFLILGAAKALETGLDYGSISGLGTQDLRISIMKIIRVVLGLVGVIAVALVLYGGFVWMTAGGNSERIEKAKKILINAVIGLVIILSAFIITSFIINRLLEATGGGLYCEPVGATEYCDYQRLGCPGVKTCLATNNWDSCQPTDLSDPDCDFSPDKECLVTNLSPKGSNRPMNSVVRVRFNHADITNPEDIKVIKVSTGEEVALDRQVSSNLVKLTPQANCSKPWADRKCFEANTAYEIRVNTGLIECGGELLVCDGGLGGSPCVATFTTGDFIDTGPPTVQIIGQQVCQNPNTLLKALADDDYGVESVEFHDVTNSLIIGLDSAVLPPLPSIAKVNWDTSGYTIGANIAVNAQAFDYDENSATSADHNFTIKAAHCCNQLKDADEDSVDCGGADCEPCQPVIEWFLPKNGAPGNIITIHGRHFTSSVTPGAGTVNFLGDVTQSADDQPGITPNTVNSECTNYWTDKEITIVVPSVPIGPLAVTRLDGLVDRTDQAPGTKLIDFDTTGPVRPGLCAVLPFTCVGGDNDGARCNNSSNCPGGGVCVGVPAGQTNDSEILQGVNFNNTSEQNEVWFAAIKGIGNPVVSSQKTINGIKVPAMQEAEIGVRSEDLASEEYSNPLTFYVGLLGKKKTFQCSSDTSHLTCVDPQNSDDQCPPDRFCNSLCQCVPRTLCDADGVVPTCDNPTQSKCEPGWYCYDPAIHTADITKQPCYCYRSLSCDNPALPGEPACHPDNSICPTNYLCDPNSNCTCQSKLGVGDQAAYSWFFKTGTSPGSCSGDPGLCRPENSLCPTDQICDQTTCQCIASPKAQCTLDDLAISFSAITGNYIEVADSDSLDIGTGDVTVAAWFKHPTADATDWGDYLVKKMNWEDCAANARQGYTLVLFRNRNNPNDGNLNKMSFVFGSGSGCGAGIYSQKTYNDNQWHHAVGVAHRAGINVNLKLYIDGILDAQTNFVVPATVDNNNDESLYIGRGFGGLGVQQYWNGGIDDVAIYKRALTQSEVISLYKNSSIPEENLLSFWRFNHDVAADETSEIKDEKEVNNGDLIGTVHAYVPGHFPCELMSCDLKPSTPACEVGPCLAGYFCYNATAKTDPTYDPEKLLCHCYPGIRCDSVESTPQCDPNSSLCPDNYSCNNTTCLCEPKLGLATASTYTWFFTSTTFGPRVVEACNRNASCSPDAITSPTPFNRQGTDVAGYKVRSVRPDDKEAPIDSIVSVRFTQLMYDRSLVPNPAESTVHPNVILEDCGPANVDFKASNCTTEVPGSVQLNSCTYQSNPVTCLHLQPTSLLQTSHWYQVQLNAKQILGSSGVNLVSNHKASGEYRWVFKTKESSAPSAVGCLSIEPASWTLNYFDDREGFWAQPTDKDNWCVDLRPESCSSYSWGTGIEHGVPAAAVIVSAATTEHPPADPPNSYDVNPDDNLATAAAHLHTAPEWVSVDATCVVPPPEENVSGYSRLTNDFNFPYVIERFPDCGTACLNARIGARFSLPMDSSSVIGALDLYICNDNPDCLPAATNKVAVFNKPTGPSPAPEKPNTYIGDVDCFDFNGDGKYDYCLLPNTYYRVVIRDTAVSDAENRPLAGLNFIDPTHPYYPTDPTARNAYSWVFKTQKNYGLCLPGQILLEPKEAWAPVHWLVNYGSSPKTAPDTCDPVNGQRLNPYIWNWDWLSQDKSGWAGTACTGQIGPPALGYFAADYLTDILDLLYCFSNKTANLRDSCGNGAIESGEDCDDGNLANDDACDSNCLNTGSDITASQILVLSENFNSFAVNIWPPADPAIDNPFNGTDYDIYKNYKLLLAPGCPLPTCGDVDLSGWGARTDFGYTGGAIIAASNNGSSAILKDDLDVNYNHYLIKVKVKNSGEDAAHPAKTNTTNNVGLTFGFHGENNYWIFQWLAIGYYNDPRYLVDFRKFAISSQANTNLAKTRQPVEENYDGRVDGWRELKVEVINHPDNTATIIGYFGPIGSPTKLLTYEASTRISGKVGPYAHDSDAPAIFDDLEVIEVNDRVCNDGIIDIGEECEPPNADFCGLNCLWVGNSNYDLAVCGNGILELGEECDPPGLGCSTECRLTGSVANFSLCGDGQIGLGEECDNGELNGGGKPADGDGDGCSANCLVQDRTWGFCRSKITNVFAFRAGGCSGGGTTDCSTLGEGEYACKPLTDAPGTTVYCNAVCGNGVTEIGEECDTGGWCTNGSNQAVLDANGYPTACNTYGTFCNTGETCRPYEGFCNSDTSPARKTPKPCNIETEASDCPGPDYGGKCWRDGCSVNCIHNGSVQEVIDPPDVGPYQIASTIADGETYPQSYISEYPPRSGPLGQAHLVVGNGPWTGLAVIERWPDCSSACLNSDIGAQFNRQMNVVLSGDPKFAFSIINPANIYFYECADAACLLPAFDPRTRSLSEGSDYRLTKHSEVLSDDSFRIEILPGYGYQINGVYVLKPNVTYRVLIDTNVRSVADEELQSLNFDKNGDKEIDSYSWVFTTQPVAGFCLLNFVKVIPPQVELAAGGGRENRQPYFSQPWTATDECGDLRLNPYSFNWRWADVIPTGFSIDGAEFVESPAGFCSLNPTNDPCTGSCSPYGSQHQDCLFDGCGNGKVEYGENCDYNDPALTLQQAAFCNNNCQWTGNQRCTPSSTDCSTYNGDETTCTVAFCQYQGTDCLPIISNCCGDGVLQIGEECEDKIDGNLCTATGQGCKYNDFTSAFECNGGTCVDYCTDSCLWLGTVSSLEVCGDGIVSSHEMCDLGTEPNYDNTDGCSNWCMYAGSITGSTSLCGNGKVEKGEECDDNNNNSRDGCSGGGTQLALCAAATTLADCQAISDPSCYWSGNDCLTRPCLVEPGGRTSYWFNNQTGLITLTASLCPGCPRLNTFTGNDNWYKSVCGNQEIEKGEECDDGNTNATDGCNNQCLYSGSYRKDNRIDPYQLVESVAVTTFDQEVKEEIQSWHKLQTDVVGLGELKINTGSGVPFMVIGHQPPHNPGFTDEDLQCRNVAIWAVFSKPLDLETLRGTCSTDSSIKCLESSECPNNGVCQFDNLILEECGVGATSPPGWASCSVNPTFNENKIKGLSYNLILGQCNQDNNCEYSTTDADYEFTGSYCKTANDCVGSQVKVTSLTSGFLSPWASYRIYIRPGTSGVASINKEYLSSKACAAKGEFECTTWDFSTDDSFCECDYLGVKVFDHSAGLDTTNDLFTCAGNACGAKTHDYSDDDVAPQNTCSGGDRAGRVCATAADCPAQSGSPTCDAVAGAPVGNQHRYEAQCYDVNNPQGVSIPIANYEGSITYEWSENDANNLITLAQTNPADQQKRYVTPASKNGESQVWTVAYQNKCQGSGQFCVTENNCPIISGTTHEKCLKEYATNQIVFVTNFICENPWPATNPPWQDSEGNCQGSPATCHNTNFKLMYCRDSGKAGTSDDLPALYLDSTDNPIVHGYTAAKNSVKDFIFTYGSDRITGYVNGNWSKDYKFNGGAMPDGGKTAGSFSIKQLDNYVVSIDTNNYSFQGQDFSSLVELNELLYDSAVNYNGHQVQVWVKRHSVPSWVCEYPNVCKCQDNPSQCKGIITNLPTGPDNPQRGSLDLGQLEAGDYDIEFRWVNDWCKCDYCGGPLSVLCNANLHFEQWGITPAGGGSDAIGIKVMPNPLHLSPATWYKSGLCGGAADFRHLCFSDADCTSFVDTDLMAYWRFDEGSGDKVFDQTVNNNDGSINNGAAWAAGGKIGQALSFDGTDDYIEVADNDSLDIGTGDVTVAAWFKHPTADATDWGDYLVKKMNWEDCSANARQGYNLVLFRNRNNPNDGNLNKMSFVFGGGSGCGAGIYSQETYNDNQWHQAVGVAHRAGDNLNLKLYIDGNLDKEANVAVAAAVDNNNSEPLYIGRGFGGLGVRQYWNGLIDEVRIYSRALSAEEIKALAAINYQQCELNVPLPGSPQSVVVDGYQAIQDGRTVYVGAANLTNSPSYPNDLYSNIYLISYNQDASAQTKEIFSRILDPTQQKGVWYFNTNPEFINHRICHLAGYYQETKNICGQSLGKIGFGSTDYPSTPIGSANYDTCGDYENKGDCENTVYEGNTDGKTNAEILGCYWSSELNTCLAKSCQLIYCQSDDDCPNFDCAANKEKLVRDAKRFGDLRDVQITLENHSDKTGQYPLLTAGSYVASTTFSVWPSWQGTLGADLGKKLPLDPINKFRSCPAVDLDQQQTCWNDVTKQFSCPADMRVYAYRSTQEGLSYELYTTFEYQGSPSWRTRPDDPPLDSLYELPLSFVDPLSSPCKDLNFETHQATVGGGTTSVDCEAKYCYGPYWKGDLDSLRNCTTDESKCQAKYCDDNEDNIIDNGEQTKCFNSSNCSNKPCIGGGFCSGDADFDGHCDVSTPKEDNCDPDTYCPDNPASCYNPDQINSNGDSQGDVCDNTCSGDQDNDGTCDDLDNCRTVYNPDQIDQDNDGIGDACDPCTDLDGDGFWDKDTGVNEEKICPRDNCSPYLNGFCRVSGADPHQYNGQRCNSAADCPSTYECFVPFPNHGSPGVSQDRRYYCLKDGVPRAKICQIPADCKSGETCDQPSGDYAYYNPFQEDYDNDDVGYICDNCIDFDKDGLGDYPFFTHNAKPESAAALSDPLNPLIEKNEHFEGCASPDNSFLGFNIDEDTGKAIPNASTDLDNCPAGPYGAKCYDEFGIEISCNNPKVSNWVDLFTNPQSNTQKDFNLNGLGDICDFLSLFGDGVVNKGEECDCSFDNKFCQDTATGVFTNTECNLNESVCGAGQTCAFKPFTPIGQSWECSTENNVECQADVYGESCKWCQDGKTQYNTGPRCGDAHWDDPALVEGSQEECDYGIPPVLPDCTRECKFSCQQGAFLQSNEVSLAPAATPGIARISGNQVIFESLPPVYNGSVNIGVPPYRLVDKLMANAVVSGDIASTAVVFVSDTSGSMNFHDNCISNIYGTFCCSQRDEGLGGINWRDPLHNEGAHFINNYDDCYIQVRNDIAAVNWKENYCNYNNITPAAEKWRNVVGLNSCVAYCAEKKDCYNSTQIASDQAILISTAGQTRVEKLKTALTDSVNKLFTEIPNIKIGLIHFSNSVTVDTSGCASSLCNKNSQFALTGAGGKISLYTADGATHTKAAITGAENIFIPDNTNFVNKIIILMSDGHPEPEDGSQDPTTVLNTLKGDYGIKVYSAAFTADPTLKDDMSSWSSNNAPPCAAPYCYSDVANVSGIYGNIIDDFKSRLLSAININLCDLSGSNCWPNSYPWVLPGLDGTEKTYSIFINFPLGFTQTTANLGLSMSGSGIVVLKNFKFSYCPAAPTQLAVCDEGDTKNCPNQAEADGCAGRQETCDASGQWPSCGPETGYCSDTIDNDCDGQTDASDSDCRIDCSNVNDGTWACDAPAVCSNTVCGDVTVNCTKAGCLAKTKTATCANNSNDGCCLGGETIDNEYACPIKNGSIVTLLSASQAGDGAISGDANKYIYVNDGIWANVSNSGVLAQFTISGISESGGLLKDNRLFKFNGWGFNDGWFKVGGTEATQLRVRVLKDADGDLSNGLEPGSIVAISQDIWDSNLIWVDWNDSGKKIGLHTINYSFNASDMMRDGRWEVFYILSANNPIYKGQPDKNYLARMCVTAVDIIAGWGKCYESCPESGNSCGASCCGALCSAGTEDKDCSGTASSGPKSGPICGDGTCEGGETPLSCPSDCGAATACNNSLDDDSDGQTDYPADPGCSSASDNSELNSAVQCDDNIDNDGDGQRDLADSGCANLTDNDESNCGDGTCNGTETCGSCVPDCGSCPAGTYNLSVAKIGGTGKVDSSPAGITDCGIKDGVCSASFSAGTPVTLTETPIGGMGLPPVFTGWAGDACSGSRSTTCAFNLDNNKSITASFCSANSCNGSCGAGCTEAEDPDCGCSAGNSCCGAGCTNPPDIDCLAGPAPTILAPLEGENIVWGSASLIRVQVSLTDPRGIPSSIIATFKKPGSIRALGLYDDGDHGDGAQGDGIWAVRLPVTITAADGTWTVDLTVTFPVQPASYTSLRTFNVLPMSAYDCITVVNNGSSVDKLDIVYIADKYTAANINLFQQKVLDSINYLFTSPGIIPFSTQQSKINIHRIDTTIDFGCGNDGGIGNCNVSGILGYTAACPRDPAAIIVISYHPVWERFQSWGSFGSMAVVSHKAPDFGYVVVHEFGHAFGRLDDEYVDASQTDPGAAQVTNSVNCANSPAECLSKWGGSGCTSGCDNCCCGGSGNARGGCDYRDKYYRSIYSGIMKDYSRTDFGQVNKNKINYWISQYAP